MLASIRSKTGGAAVLCCRARRDGAALLTVSKLKKKRKQIAVVSIYQADHLFEYNLVPEWRCLVFLFAAPSTLGLVGRSAPKACLPSEGPYGETEDFALNIRPSSFWQFCRGPSYLVEEQQRGAVLPSVSLYLSPDRQNKVISLSWSPCGHRRADPLK